MKNIVKGAIIGLAIWVFLLAVFFISGIWHTCDQPRGMEGYSCYSFIQELALLVMSLIAFPAFYLSPIPGSINVFSLVFFIIWGALIGYFFDTKKGKRKKE